MRGPCVKNEGLVFHGTARAIRLINSLLHGKNENIPKFTENLRKFFREISPKSFSQAFLLIFKFSENCPKTYREVPKELIAQKFYRKHLPEFYSFPKFSKNLETILVNVRFQFCVAAESIGQDDAILPDDQPIKLRESRAGWLAR